MENEEESQSQESEESFNHYEGQCSICRNEICSSCGACHENHEEFIEVDVKDEA